MCVKMYCLALILTLAQLFEVITGGAVEIDKKNVNAILRSKELVMILFYKYSCKYSTQYLPIFEAAARHLQVTLEEPDKVTLGKVDCDAEPYLSDRFDIGKYPTVRIVRYGLTVKKEYRGQRSQDALVQFVLNELVDPIQQFYSMDELNNLENQRYMIIGFFTLRDSREHEIFRKVAGTRLEQCQFHVNFGGINKLIFKRDLSVDRENYDSEFLGSMTNFVDVLKWIESKCDPPLRELTFDNAEEISEEGRPFVILFHNPDDVQSVKVFENVIENELISELDNVNFLTADGNKFAHPLFHMGKSESDLPLIAIDSFIHMYLFPNFENIHTPGKLKKFIRNLKNGELHRAFHFDISPSESSEEQDEVESEETTTSQTLPKSKFKDLLPSKNRYTFARDEL